MGLQCILASQDIPRSVTHTSDDTVTVGTSVSILILPNPAGYLPVLSRPPTVTSLYKRPEQYIDCCFEYFRQQVSSTIMPDVVIHG